MSTFSPGDSVEGKYKILGLLGEGGMNRVFLVEEHTSQTKYALKVSREIGEIDSSQQQLYNQFLKEISILSTLKHKNLPAIRDYFSDGTTHCVVEEYIEGTTLINHMKKNKPTEEEVVEWAIVLCDVLELLHSGGIIFRDMKPDNIMLAKNGELKLIDFDIARHYKPGKVADTLMLGTPGYAAPESYGISQSDARSDIYSLGATLHHLLTGVNPQDKPFDFEPVRRHRRHVNSELEKIVMKAVEKKPEDRFSKVSEMKIALQKVKAKTSQFIPPVQQAALTPGAASLNQWGKIAGAIMAILYFLGTCIWGLMPNQEYTEKKPVRSRPPVTEISPEKGIEQAEGNATRAQAIPIGNAVTGVLSYEIWRNPAGDSVDIYPPTYTFDPAEMTKPVVTITPSVVSPGSPLEVTFKFMVHYHTHYSKNPWEHRIRIRFVMPLDNKSMIDPVTEAPKAYERVAEIPGKLISYSISAVDQCRGDFSEVIIPVEHDDTFVIGKVMWKPSPELPSLKYKDSKPQIGPRVILDLQEQHYSWRYTQGFIIRESESASLPRDGNAKKKAVTGKQPAKKR